MMKHEVLCCIGRVLIWLIDSWERIAVGVVEGFFSGDYIP